MRHSRINFIVGVGTTLDTLSRGRGTEKVENCCTIIRCYADIPIMKNIIVMDKEVGNADYRRTSEAEITVTVTYQSRSFF
jgi:hypothetical protein